MCIPGFTLPRPRPTPMVVSGIDPSKLQPSPPSLPRTNRGATSLYLAGTLSTKVLGGSIRWLSAVMTLYSMTGLLSGLGTPPPPPPLRDWELSHPELEVGAQRSTEAMGRAANK